MDGWVEKKGSGMFARWQSRFFRLDPFALLYYEAEVGGDPKDIVDLRQTMGAGFGDPLKAASALSAPAAERYVHRGIIRSAAVPLFLFVDL
jgi:hypothetical protein